MNGVLGKLKKNMLSMRGKLGTSFSLLVVLLLLTGIISIFEYSRMSEYMSGMIADNIHDINDAQNLALACDGYNLDILALIGEPDAGVKASFVQSVAVSNCDSIRAEFMRTTDKGELAKKVNYSYTAYMLTSMELENVMASNFIDSRSWFFERLQPRYDALRRDITVLDNAIYTDMKENSMEVEDLFYRSMIPGFVSVGACIVLVLLLLFFIVTDYVNPFMKMSSAVHGYNSGQKRKYNVTFEGDQQMTALNEGIRDLVEENIKLSSRIKSMTKSGDSQ